MEKNRLLEVWMKRRISKVLEDGEEQEQPLPQSTWALRALLLSLIIILRFEFSAESTITGAKLELQAQWISFERDLPALLQGLVLWDQCEPKGTLVTLLVALPAPCPWCAQSGEHE